MEELSNDDPERGEYFQHKMLKATKGGGGTLRVNAHHHAESRLTLEQMREFLAASEELVFTLSGRGEIYNLVERTLGRQQYLGLPKKDKGVVRHYLSKLSGRSLPQITRLIRQYRQSGVVRPRQPRRRRFPTRYTPGDIALLAAADAPHEGLSGPAVRRILWREYCVYHKEAYQRLASISSSHIYNLRRGAAYRQHHVHHTKTRARAVSIGERRKPDHRGRPGYLRVDTVHQGDTSTRRGLHHINAVDALTQWQIVGCCQTISESHLIPVLEAMLHQYPFRIEGVSFRQRLGVYQLPGREIVEQTAGGGVHQVAGASHNRQRAGRGQEWGGGAQTHRTRTDRSRACRRVSAFLHGRVQSLLELPSPLRRHLEVPRLPHALREAAFARQWESYLKPGVTAAFLERHNVRQEPLKDARSIVHRTLSLPPWRACPPAAERIFRQAAGRRRRCLTSSSTSATMDAVCRGRRRSPPRCPDPFLFA